MILQMSHHFESSDLVVGIVLDMIPGSASPTNVRDRGQRRVSIVVRVSVMGPTFQALWRK